MVPARLFDSFLWPCLSKSSWRIKQLGMWWCDSISGLLIDISVPLPIVYFSTPVPKVPFSTISSSFLLFCAKSVLYNSPPYPVPGCRPGQRMTLRQRVSSWNLQPDMPNHPLLFGRMCRPVRNFDNTRVCSLYAFRAWTPWGIFRGVGFLRKPSDFIEWVVGFDVCEIDPSDGMMSLVWRPIASHTHFGGGGPFFGIPIFSKSPAHNSRFPWIEVRWRLAF